MPIALTCSKCGKSLSVRDDAAGKRVRCSCGTALAVPSVLNAHSPKPSLEPLHVEKSSSPAKKPSLPLILGGCGVLLVLLLLFGVTIALVVYAGTKPKEQTTASVHPVSNPKSKDESSSHLLDAPDSTRPPARPAPDHPPSPATPPPAEVLPKTLALMDRLNIEVAAPQASDAPTPATWSGHTASIRGVAYTDDGRFVVSVSGAIEKDASGKEDNSIRVWDARHGRQLRKLDDFREALDAVSVSPGGRFAVFGHSGHYEEGKWVDAVDHFVRLWDIQDNREIFFRKGEDDSAAKADSLYRGLDSSVFSTAFSPDRRRVVGVANSGKLVLWASDNGQIHIQGKVIPVARQRINPKNFSPVSLSLSGINCVRFTPDGRWLLMAGGDYTVRLFDAETGRQVYVFESHRDIVWAVATMRTADGRLLGLSGGGGQQRLGGGGFEPGARDYAIRLWDLQTRREIRRFIGHEGNVSSLVFCPNRRHFLSTGNDRTVRLWDIASGKLLRTYQGHTDLIRSVSVSPDGRSAVSGGDDCLLRYWRLPATAVDVVHALNKNSRPDLMAAMHDLDAMGPELRGVYPQLVQTLSRNDKTMSDLALTILRQLGQPDKEWLGGLRQLLIGPLPAARSFAADSLAALGSDALPAVDELRKALFDTDVAVRRAVVAALTNLGKDAKAAADNLGRMADAETDAVLKTEAMHALGKIDGKNKVVLRYLRRAIADGSGAERTAALKSLLDLGPQADDLEACLRAYLDPVNRQLARAVMEKMPLGKTKTPRLAAALVDARVEVRLLAVTLLAGMGADAADAKPALRKCLKDRDERLRFQSAVVLAALAPDDKEIAAEALPLFIAALSTNDNAKQAREAIVRHGKTATAALFKALRDNGGDAADQRAMRRQIYGVFSDLGPKAYSFQNSAALKNWAKKEQTRAVRYGSDELFRAAFQAVTAIKPARR